MSQKLSCEELEKRVEELERTIDRLADAEKHSRRILDCHASVIYTKDLQGRYTSINKQFENHSGLTSKEVIGKTDFELFPASVAHRFTQNDQHVIKTKTPLEVEEFGPVRGSMHLFLSAKYPIMKEDGEIYGICGISTDITDKKRTEEDLRRSNRALIVLKEAGRALLRAVDESSLIRESCRILVEEGGYSMAWVGYADDPSTKIVTPAGHWGIRSDYLDHVTIAWDDSPAGQGPTGKAIRTAKPWIAKRIGTDPHFASWREAALERGLNSSIALPLCHDNDCFGALSIYAPEADAFDGDEIDLLVQLANELAYGILSLRNQNKHKTAAAALRESDAHLRILIETIPDLVWLKDRDGFYITCNPKFERFFGAKESEIRGKTDYDFVDEELAHFFREKDRIAIESGKPSFNEEELTFADDGHKELLETIKTPMFDADGKLIGVLGIARDITDRKRTEQELARNEALFHGLFDNMTSGCGIYEVINDGSKGSDYIVKGFNRKSLDLERKTLDQVIGGSLFDLRPNIDDYGLIQVMKQVWKTGIPAYHPVKIYQDENFSNYYENHIFKIPTGEVVTVYNDVTEQKCAEIELKESKERFELAMRFSNDGIFDWNLVTNKIYYSPGWKKMLGYDDDEIKNEFSEWERLTEPEDAKASWLMLNEVIAGKRDRFEKEFRMRHKSGNRVDILSRANVIRDEKGAAVRVVGTHVDISERKRAERKILSQKQEAERYLNLAGVMFIGLDTDGLVNLANQKACKILECDEADIVSKNWFEHFIPHSARDDVRAAFEQIIRGRIESVEYYENPVVSQTGKEKIIAWHNTYISDDDGAIIGILASGEDITEKRRLEAQLQRAQKMESIGTLAGGIAHDFNNILAPIIGMSELLLEDLRPDSLEHENAGEILKAGMRGKDLVKQILAFSRKAEHRLMPVGVQHILKEVLKLSRSTIPSYIEISRDIQNDCGPVMADGSQIHQVVMNLITNAYHAVEQNGGKISVQLKEIEITAGDSGFDAREPGAYARLSVSDTGSGIDPAAMDKIFEPYFTTKAQGKGTGLGLAVVYGIVKTHEGDVKVYSEPGKGTTFNVYLPLMKKAPAHGSSEAPESLPTGNERILLIDDEAAIVRLEKQMLERLGYVVTSRTGSIEALETFKARPQDFDLVITDMTMPNMTGDRLAKELLSIRPDVPVIICTGFSERINREAAERIGIDGFLMKPAVKSELAKMVRSVLDAHLNLQPKA